MVQLTTTLKLLSLFSGIGAFEKALTNLQIDYDLVGFSEIDKFAIKSYCAVHDVPEEKNLGDINKINCSTLPKDIDLITYGFPCQDISIAGKKEGFVKENGSLTRSGLFFEALRIIKETKPKIAIAENVKALTNKKFAKEFATVLSSLEEAGYVNYWKVLNAKDYGIPQNRERVFIVSIRKQTNKKFEFPQTMPLQKCLKDMLDESVDDKYYLSSKMINYLFNTTKRNSFSYTKTDIYGISKTITIKEGQRATSNYIQEIMQIGQMYPNSGNPQAGRIYAVNGISPSIDSCQGGNRMPKVVETDGVLMRIRRLTPNECWRLMGFSDEDFVKAREVNSDTQLYKQAGNSIVVNVLMEIFKQLEKINLLER